MGRIITLINTIITVSQVINVVGDCYHECACITSWIHLDGGESECHRSATNARWINFVQYTHAEEVSCSVGHDIM